MSSPTVPRSASADVHSSPDATPVAPRSSAGGIPRSPGPTPIPAPGALRRRRTVTEPLLLGPTRIAVAQLTAAWVVAAALFVSWWLTEPGAVLDPGWLVTTLVLAMPVLVLPTGQRGAA